MITGQTRRELANEIVVHDHTKYLADGDDSGVKRFHIIMCPARRYVYVYYCSDAGIRNVVPDTAKHWAIFWSGDDRDELADMISTAKTYLEVTT